MFHFLKKPTFQTKSDIQQHEDTIAVSNSDMPLGEDVGQIAVDVLETGE